MSQPSLTDLDRKHLIHPLVSFREHERRGPTILESGHRAYLRDSEGKELLDAFSGGAECDAQREELQVRHSHRRRLTSPIPALPHQALEVVPVGARLPALKGQPLALRVLFHGKPVAGAHILRDFVNDSDGDATTTGPDGTVTIRVRNQGG